jgi:hypothetical protein
MLIVRLPDTKFVQFFLDIGEGLLRANTGIDSLSSHSPVSRSMTPWSLRATARASWASGSSVAALAAWACSVIA